MVDKAHPRLLIELLLLRLEVWGHGMLWENRFALRKLRRTNHRQWLEVYCAMRGKGISEQDIREVCGTAHAKGCACWECVRKLHATVLRSARKRNLHGRRPLPKAT